jgi:glycogen operon protein
VLRQRSFFSGREVHPDGSTDLAWYGGDGELMGSRWHGPAIDVLQALYDGAWLGERSVLVAVNGSAWAVEVTLPAAPGATAYELLWDSSDARPSAPSQPVAPGSETRMGPASMRVWRVSDST